MNVMMGTNPNTDSQKWVAGWGADISAVRADYREYFADVTFRYKIFPTVAAEALRLHFSAIYNTEDTEITQVFLAKTKQQDGDSSEILSDTSTQVTFHGGNSSLLLKAGTADVVSDPIHFVCTPGEEFSVSLYFRKLTQAATGHSNGNTKYIKKYACKGNYATKESLSYYGTLECETYVFLNTIDFLTQTKDDVKAIVAFGDSITAQPWPDCLAHRIFESGIVNRTVIRRGIGGNRILRGYKFANRQHFGPAGVERFSDAIRVAGADRVFVLHGINDLIHPTPSGKYSPMSDLPTVEEMIAGYTYYIDEAHRQEKKIYLATIMPCAYCLMENGEREKIRLAINNWIRTQAPIDGCLDFEAYVRDPENAQKMCELYDCGDHLHPNFNGAMQLANSIPMDIITKS